MPTKSTVKPIEEKIQLPAMNLERIELTLVGDSPLIVHKWSEKAKKAMLDKQMKVANTGREAKNPEEEYEACIYRDEDGDFAFPSVAFKSAAVGACRFSDGLKMTSARGAFHVIGEFCKINGTPTPREDMVRLASGVGDIRYRAEYREWSTRVRIIYNKNVLSAEQIITLFSLAGFGSGIGEWRPERNGSYGRFHVAREGELS